MNSAPFPPPCSHLHFPNSHFPNALYLSLLQPDATPSTHKVDGGGKGHAQAAAKAAGGQLTDQTRTPGPFGDDGEGHLAAGKGRAAGKMRKTRIKLNTQQPDREREKGSPAAGKGHAMGRVEKTQIKKDTQQPEKAEGSPAVGKDRAAESGATLKPAPPAPAGSSESGAASPASMSALSLRGAAAAAVDAVVAVALAVGLSLLASAAV